jgi:ABC-type branched-subunit amino acid transport system substrate-binding protein
VLTSRIGRGKRMSAAKFRGRAPRVLAVAISAAVMAYVAAACGSSGQAANSGSSHEITLGMIVSLSGPYAQYGDGQKVEAQVAANDANKAGGVVVGGVRYKVVFKVMNDNSDPQTSVADAIQFSSEGVKILFGPIATEAVSVLPVSARYRMIDFSEASEATTYLDQGAKYPLIFGILPSANIRGSLSMTALKRWVPSATKVAWMGPNDTLAASLASSLEATAKSDGITFKSFLYPPGTTDISSVASAVKSFGPSAIYMEPADADVVNMLNALNSAGVSKSIPILSFAGTPQLDLPHSGGHPMMFYMLTPAITGGTAVQKQWLTEQAAAGRQDGYTLPVSVTSQYPAYFNTVPLVLKAMEIAKTTTNIAAIAAAIRTEPRVNGLVGPYGFDGTNSAVLSGEGVIYATGSLADHPRDLVVSP